MSQIPKDPNLLKGRFFGVFESEEQLRQQSTIAGQIRPMLQKFKVDKDQMAGIVEGIKSVAQIGDITLLIVVGWVLLPLMKLWYDRLMSNTTNLVAASTSGDISEEADGTLTYKPFEKRKIYHFFKVLSEMARLAMLVYVADLIKIFLVGAGFEIPQSSQLTHVFAYSVYTVWFFYRISVFKGYVLKRMVKKSKTDPGRVQIINRFTDAGILVLGVFALYEILNLQMGLALRGVVAVGSAWTLVISLALKDIAR